MNKQPGGPKRGVGETRDEVARLTSEGFKPPQIAKILNITRGAVYQHLQKLKAEEQAS